VREDVPLESREVDELAVLALSNGEFLVTCRDERSPVVTNAT
jgi:hypothetical protein